MDDALKTTAWLEPNTFMDIISPASKKTSPRSQPNRSKTLMRTAVKRPDFGVSASFDQGSGQPVRRQTTVNRFRADLSEAASLTSRSPLIDRFKDSSLYRQPVEQPAAAFEASAEEPQQDTNYQDFSAEPIAVAMEEPTINVFKNNLAMPGSLQYSQPYKAQGSKLDLLKRLSGWSVLAIAIIGIVTGGVLINSNLNRLELYVASSKAGFAATLPSALPSGYGLSGIGTATGTIQATFKSSLDNQNYTIFEKQSSAASGSQLNSYVQSKAGLNFQTITTASGKTIYIYGNNNATWVSGGIWYVIQDNNVLNTQQIINIANSM